MLARISRAVQPCLYSGNRLLYPRTLSLYGRFLWLQACTTLPANTLSASAVTLARNTAREGLCHGAFLGAPVLDSRYGLTRALTPT